MWDILKQGTAVVVCLRTPPEYHLSWFSWMLFSTLQRRTNRVEQPPHSTLLHVPACLVVAHPPFLVTPPSCFFFLFFFLQSTFGIGDSRSVTTCRANRGPVGVMRCSAVNKGCQDGWFAGTQHWTERVYMLRCILELSPPCDLHK